MKRKKGDFAEIKHKDPKILFNQYLENASVSIGYEPIVWKNNSILSSVLDLHTYIPIMRIFTVPEDPF